MLAIAIAMASVGVPATPAAALTGSEIEQRVVSLKSSLRAIATDLQAAEDELIRTSAEMKAHDTALRQSERRRAELSVSLGHRAAELYVIGTVDDFEIVHEGVGTYIDRMAYLEVVRRGEKALLEELRALQETAATESALLAAARARALDARNRLDSRQGELSRQLAELKQLQSFLGDTSGRHIIGNGTGFQCPVVGPNVPLDNFGDPRPGGPHAGVDIRADYGQYVRTVLAGTVVDTPTGSWWGIGIIVRDLTGTEWYYAHLSSRSVRIGQKLAPGEVIARVGCTGTCYGTHLHFEWHPGGGDPRDPYGLVSGAC